MAAIGRGRGDAESCAADLGGRVSVEDCADALCFWEEEGLLVRAKDAADKPAKGPKPAAKKPTSDAVSVVAPAKPARSTRPAVPVAQRQRDADFWLLLEATESRLGKALSHADQNRLMDLYDVSELPVEVILMAVAYAVKAEKPKISYIQAVVRSWEEQGITTVDAADRHLCYLERLEQAWVQVDQWLDLTAVRPTLSQKTMAEKWVFQWSVSRELLLLAYERCVDNTGKFQASYIDRVLESWRQDGLDTPAKVKAAAAKSRRASAAPKPGAGHAAGGLNVDQYAAMVQTHTPKYRKKG